MSFTIQLRQFNGHWYRRRTNPYHGTLEAAVAACCLCDEDGIFPPDLRVVDAAGTVVMTGKQWLQENRGRA